MNEVSDVQPDSPAPIAPPLPPLVPVSRDPATSEIVRGSGVLPACRNCGYSFSALEGGVNFCPSCGQDTHPHAPSAWEFIHEFIIHYVALEGKLWKTLGLLFFKPGQLSIEFRAGRKVRYVAPLRIYITASFLFFLVVKIAGWGNIVQINTDSTTSKPSVEEKVVTSAPPTLSAPAPDKADAVGLRVQNEVAPIVFDRTGVHVSEPAGGAKPGAIPDDVLKAPVNTKLDCAPDETLCQMIESRVSEKWRGKTGKDVTVAVKQSTVSNMPYALFLMLPLFAWLTWLAYWRRRYTYGEHMVYAFHVHAFTFFMFLAKAQLPPGPGEVVVFLGAIYYFIAMHRYFGGRWWANILRYAFIGIVYPTAIVVVTAFVIVLSLYL